MNFATGIQANLFGLFASRNWAFGPHVRFYGSGRAAVLDTARYCRKHFGITQILMPAYQCVELIDYLRHEFEIITYRINPDLTPSVADLDVKMNAGCLLVLVDYFSSVPSQPLYDIMKRYRNPIILDAVHSFCLEPPQMPEGSAKVFWILGYRKVFWRGIGAIVLSSILLPEGLFFSSVTRLKRGSIREANFQWKYGFILRYFLNVFINWDTHFQWMNRFEQEHSVSRQGLMANIISPMKALFLEPSEPSMEWPDLSGSIDKDSLVHASSIKRSVSIVARKIIR